VSDIVFEDAEAVTSSLQNLDLSGSVVVLTGASGLIGTHILSVLGLLERDGRGPSTTVAVSKANLPKFVNPPPKRMTSLQVDLTDRAQKINLPRADFIIHAAGYGQPAKFLSNPLLTLDLNTRVTAELIEHLSSSGRFLFLSTSEIYSGLTGTPYLESLVGTTNTDHIRAPYIEGKRCGETICKAALGPSQRYVIARVALAYGPGVFADDDRVLYSFVRQAISQRQIRVSDAGLANRTYCYVSDTIEVLLRLLFKPQLSGIFNVGGISRTTIRELALLVGQLTGCQVSFSEPTSGLMSAPVNVEVDLTKTTIQLGHRQFVSLEEGLKRTLKWWRDSQ
jgi:nucleoside-diphosphate-sugar epimerase